jgi:hypothetical protein
MVAGMPNRGLAARVLSLAVEALQAKDLDDGERVAAGHLLACAATWLEEPTERDLAEVAATLFAAIDAADDVEPLVLAVAALAEAHAGAGEVLVRAADRASLREHADAIGAIVRQAIECPGCVALARFSPGQLHGALEHLRPADRERLVEALAEEHAERHLEAVLGDGPDLVPLDTAVRWLGLHATAARWLDVARRGASVAPRALPHAERWVAELDEAIARCEDEGARVVLAGWRAAVAEAHGRT